ncbi:olfactory receptor 5B12-like [Discoglossus pictus]
MDMHQVKTLENKTVEHEFFLLGFSDFPKVQFILFVVFLPIYMMTLTGNLIILLLIWNDQNLHNPMYFFLGHLACIDAFSSTVTAPRMIVDLLSKIKSISHMACVTQMFFFLLFISAEVFLLAVMSYDRYVAICQPLHYTSIMSWKVCILMALGAWALGFTNSLIHAIGTLRLTFCGQNIIYGFFCDFPLLLQLSCTDIFINFLNLCLATLTLGLFAFGVTFIPYLHIVRLILRIKTKKGEHKAFSTCTSHLTVVSIFYGTVCFTYLRPAPTHHDIGERIISVIYTMITPLLNPFIYSLRNKELITALRKFTNTQTLG